MKHPWLELKNWAVLGASTNEESYGYKIAKKLVDHDYEMIPISPKYEQVCGKQVYPDLNAYDGAIDVVDFVVNPAIGMSLLDQVIEKGIKKILLQPGTASEELIEKAQAHDIEVLESCVLVLLSWR